MNDDLKNFLTAASQILPAPAGVIVEMLAALVDPVHAAIQSGADASALVCAIDAAMVAATDAQMKLELK